MTGHINAAATWLRAHASKLAAGLAILTVAVVTGRVSYWHIYDLSVTLHQPPKVARLMPFGVDGLMVVGSIALLTECRWGWAGVVSGTGISLFANWESGFRYGWLAAAWAMVASLSFALSTLILERWLKAQATQGDTAPSEFPVSLPHPAAKPVQRPPAPPPSHPAGLADPTPDSVPRKLGRGAGQQNREAILHLRALHPDEKPEWLAVQLGMSAKTVSRHLAAANGSGS
jgi:Protein of unknown function (DUF2637)